MSTLELEGPPVANAAHRLLRSLKRARAADSITSMPEYDREGLAAIGLESTAKNDEVGRLLGDGNPADAPDGLKVLMVFNDAEIQRNKRCVLAYHFHRLCVLKRLRWEVSDDLPPQVAANCSAGELEFAKEYGRLIADHSESLGLDLTRDMQPPKELMVEVRVLETCQAVNADGHTLDLEAGSTHLLQQAEVGHLLRRGVVSLLERDESC